MNTEQTRTSENIFTDKKEELGICSTKEWLLIANLFKGKWTDEGKHLIE